VNLNKVIKTEITYGPTQYIFESCSAHQTEHDGTIFFQEINKPSKVGPLICENIRICEMLTSKQV